MIPAGISGDGLGGMEEVVDGFRCFSRDDGGEGPHIGLLHVAQTAEVVEQTLRGCGADSGDVEQFRIAVAHGAALAVVADGEAVALVANHLHEMQHGRAAVEDDGLIFVAVEVDDFFALGDGGEGLGGEAELFQALRRRRGSWPRPPSMRMSEAWACLLFLQATVAAVYDFAHGGEVIDSETVMTLNLR